MMPAKLKSHLPALLCALISVLCYLAVRPYAEIGIDDEWSYVKSAQVLAQTGHIVYNGWASPILGWQLYFGALFVKLFGFSFTAVRLSTFIESVATAFLLQRSMLLAGINQRNATLATLTFILSPLYLPLTFTFMTDVPSVFCIVLCLYMCLRALVAESRRSAILWIALAALVNAVLGTVRQIAWLGVLVMVPCTLWLLRRDRRVVVTGALSCIVGAGFVFAAMHWFAQQRYSVAYSLNQGNFGLLSAKFLGAAALLGSGELSLLLMPVLIMFVGIFRKWNRRMAALVAGGLVYFALLGVFLFLRHRLGEYLAPFDVSYIMGPAFQNLHLFADPGAPRDIVRDGVRLILTALTVIAFLGLVSCLFGSPDSRPPAPGNDVAISWRKLGILLGPFTIAYGLLIMSRASHGAYFDRYLLPLLAIGLLVLTRYYQQKMRTNLPLACVFLIVIFAGVSIAGAHDEFSMYRGYVAAINEMRSSGVPATAIWGPWEFDGWTEVEKTGYVSEPTIGLPKGVANVPPRVRDLPPDCKLSGFPDAAPAINPLYATSLNADDCDGQASFPPVAYRTWIPPHNRSIYIVKVPGSLSR